MDQEGETTGMGADAMQPFQPREDLVTTVLSLGFSKNAVIKVNMHSNSFWFEKQISTEIFNRMFTPKYLQLVLIMNGNSKLSCKSNLFNQMLSFPTDIVL